MEKIWLLWPPVLPRVLRSPGPAVAEPVLLTVDDAVRTAVDQNLGLQVQTYNPAIAATDIRRARSIYDPMLTALLNYRDGSRPAGPTSAFDDRSRFIDANASLDQLLPTGATASASFTNFWSKGSLGVATSACAARARLSLSHRFSTGLGSGSRSGA